MAQTQIIGKTATSVKTIEGITVVKYHQTNVVEIERTGKGKGLNWKPVVKVTLRSGGWRTLTTKVRMNQAANQFGLDFQVYQENFEWYVQVGGHGNGKTLQFEDGMEFYI